MTLIVGPAAFAALTWGSVVAVVIVFVYLAYAVVRAGGVDLLGEDGT